MYTTNNSVYDISADWYIFGILHMYFYTEQGIFFDEKSYFFLAKL
jgi:hypothetical protein